MNHYLLIYHTAADYLQRRAEFRSAHLALAWQAAERGELLLGGAVGDPADSALLLFRCDNADIPAAFAKGAQDERTKKPKEKQTSVYKKAK